MIWEFSLPILGKEEDAADNIATMLLLAKQAEDANRALIDSAQGWRLSSTGLRGAESVEQRQNLEMAALYDSHSPNSLRAGQIGCLMVGSRREVFAHVGVDLGLDRQDREVCRQNLSQIIMGWVRLKSSFIPMGKPNGHIFFQYDATDQFTAEREMLANSGMFAALAESVLGKYELPRDVTLRAGSCGAANAYYDPKVGELLICYELAQFYLAMN